MKPAEVSKAFQSKIPVLGKGERGFVVNLSADGRPIFSSSLESGGIGRTLNFQDIQPISVV